MRNLIVRVLKLLGLYRVFDSKRQAWARFADYRVPVIYSRWFNKPLVYVVGDSHVMVFKGSIPFLAYHIGAVTAFNLPNKNSSTKSNEKLFEVIDKAGKSDVVMLCFGEIDCRIHIYNQHKKSNDEYSMDELIERTISNYGCVMAQLKHRGVNFCVYSIPPITDVGNVYNYRFYGTADVRSKITRAFNKKLRTFCDENGYKFIDIYDKVADKDGLMQKKYALDKVHLNKKVVSLVRAELRKKMRINI